MQSREITGYERVPCAREKTSPVQRFFGQWGTREKKYTPHNKYKQALPPLSHSTKTHQKAPPPLQPQTTKIKKWISTTSAPKSSTCSPQNSAPPCANTPTFPSLGSSSKTFSPSSPHPPSTPRSSAPSSSMSRPPTLPPSLPPSPASMSSSASKPVASSSALHSRSSSARPSSPSERAESSLVSASRWATRRSTAPTSSRCRRTPSSLASVCWSWTISLRLEARRRPRVIW